MLQKKNKKKLKIKKNKEKKRIGLFYCSFIAPVVVVVAETCVDGSVGS